MKKAKKSAKSTEEHVEIDAGSSDMKLIIAIVVIIAVFSLLFLGFWLLSREPEAKTIQDLHDENLEGKLSSDEGYIYNGYSFVKANGMWFSQVQRFRSTDLYNVQFHYGPRDLGDVPLLGNISDFKEFNGTYITFDPTGDNHAYTALASAELSLNLAQVFNMLPVAACSKNETTVCHSRPIVNCQNATNPVIFMEKSDSPAVIRENEACIRVLGNGTDIVKATDRLLFDWFGFMK